MLRPFGLAVFVLGLALGFGPGAGPVGAQDFDLLGDDGGEKPFDVTADDVHHDAARGIYTASGDVRITQPDRVLKADWLTFSNKTLQGVAAGNVVVIDGTDTLRADVLHFQINTLTGVVFDGEVSGTDTKFKVRGDVIQRNADGTYTTDEGEMTSCRCPKGEKLPWKISAKSADLDFGGYGTSRNTTFDVLGIPILWFPWMVYPLKSGRQTGFLFPELNSSARTGLDITLPFFWAAHDRVNVTVDLSYLVDHGFKPGVDVEYVFGERSEGSLYGSFLPNDKSIDELEGRGLLEDDRWAVEWIHNHYLPYDFRFVVDARFFSDNLYTFDFSDFSEYRRDRFIESTAFVERRFGPLDRYSAFVNVLHRDDQQNPEGQDRDDYLLNRLPQVHVSAPPAGVGPLIPGLVTAFDVDYTHFWAPESAVDRFGPATVVGDDQFVDIGIDAIPDGEEVNEQGNVVALDGRVLLSDGTVLSAEEALTLQEMQIATGTDPLQALLLDPDGALDNFDKGGPEGDGLFEEGELLADRGHRFILHPRLAYPFRVADLVEVYPEIGYYGTLYSTDAQGFADRHLATFQLDMRTRMTNTFEAPLGIGNLLHVLEPRVNYSGVTDASQRDNPLFVPGPFVPQKRIRQLALWNKTLDPSDRIAEQHAVTLALGNRFYKNREETDGVRLFSEVTGSLQYDFAQSSFTGFYLDGRLDPGWNLVTKYNLGWDLEEGNFDEALFELAWKHPDGHDFVIFYRYLEDVPRFFESFQDDDRFDEFVEGGLSIHQIRVGGRWAINQSWALFYEVGYSFEDSFLIDNAGGFEYISKCKCWAIRLEFEDENQRGFEVGFRYTIIGLGDDTTRPFRGRGRRRSGERENLDDALVDYDFNY